MSRACTVCAHPKVEEINAEVARGLSNRDTARRFKVSKSAVDRHREHILEVLSRATEAKEVASADHLLAEVEALRIRAMSLLEKAEGESAFTAAAGLMREARGCLELLGRLAGELREGPVVNIVAAPEWTSLRETILVALAPFPEARLAVAEALRRREALGLPEAVQARPLPALEAAVVREGEP
jgi:hypothetical protein